MSSIAQTMDGTAAMAAVRPIWTRVERAALRVPLAGRWLLHAGPAYPQGQPPPAPVLSSAVLACRHEGWAASDEDARALIEAGEVCLHPTHAFRGVTPLAAIVSPSTAVAVVEDEAGRVAPTFAPLGATRGADLRFGTRDSAILTRLARRDGEEARRLSASLATPLDLLACAIEGVRDGDDLHNRTTAATAAVAREFARRFGPHPCADAVALLDALAATPLYFLTLWMAAARLILSAAEGRAPSALVTALGGNGRAFGVQLAGAPGRWVCAPADPPAGPRLPGADPEAGALGAIGDSAVIDALGFGGQLLAHATESRTALEGYLPAEPGETAALLRATHPAFAGPVVRIGLDARRIVETGVAPLVTLAMVEAHGRAGLLGRGVYRPPVALFARALQGIGEG